MFFSNILSNMAYVYYRWYLNNSTALSALSFNYHSGSGMITVELAVGDTVSLKYHSNNIRFENTSCYTLIKIK